MNMSNLQAQVADLVTQINALISHTGASSYLFVCLGCDKLFPAFASECNGRTFCKECTNYCECCNSAYPKMLQWRDEEHDVEACRKYCLDRRPCDHCGVKYCPHWGRECDCHSEDEAEPQHPSE